MNTTVTNKPDHTASAAPVTSDAEATRADYEDIQNILNNTFMMVSMRVRKPNQARMDKQESIKVALANNANQKAVKVNKNIWGGGWVADKVTALSNLLHRANTVKTQYCRPFGMGGAWILPNSSYFDFEQDLGKIRAEAQSLLDQMQPHYARMVATAKQDLGDLAANTHFPTWDEFTASAGIDVEYSAIPAPSTVGDFNVEHELARKFAGEAVANRNAVIEQLQRDAWERIQRPLTKLINSTRPKEEGRAKPKVFDTLLPDVEALVRDLGNFNILNDPALEQIRQKIEATIKDVDTETLRKNPSACEATHEKANEVANDLAALGW